MIARLTDLAAQGLVGGTAIRRAGSGALHLDLPEVRHYERMPKPTSLANRTSLYRLVNVKDLSEGVRTRYLERATFSATTTAVGGRPALLVQGRMETETVRWAGVLHALTEEPVDLGNAVAAAVLLIRDAGATAWALSYGMGFQLLEVDKIDSGFGQRFAVRTADPATLSSLTRTTLDQRQKIDRLSIPGGEHLRGFGVGDVGELVTRLVGRTSLPGLVGGQDATTIRGSDALNLPLGRSAADLLKDLDHVQELLARSPAPELEMLEQLTAVKRPGDIAKLDSRLVDELGKVSSDTGRLGISWPSERTDEQGTASAHRFVNAGRRHSNVHDGMPTLDGVLDVLSSVDPGQRLDWVRRVKLQLFSDPEGQDPVSGAIPVIRWLAFETDLSSDPYCLHDGRWYQLGQGYAAKLAQQADAILAGRPAYELPDWPTDEDEGRYNQRMASAIGGLLLDKRLVRTEMHTRGVELCDVLAPDGAFIHVKKLDRSTSASHALAQALVSADAMIGDAQARDALRAEVASQAGDEQMIPDRLQTVVLALGTTRVPLTSSSLFTFTQVTLVRNVTLLQQRGVRVLVAPIKRSSGEPQ